MGYNQLLEKLCVWLLEASYPNLTRKPLAEEEIGWNSKQKNEPAQTEEVDSSTAVWQTWTDGMWIGHQTSPR